MTARQLPYRSPVADRHPRSDRLILHRFLSKAGGEKSIEGTSLDRAHEILIKWADLETSGRLAEMHENQLQGDFLSEIFGEALGYRLSTQGEDGWEIEQHWTIPEGGEPDAVIGNFSSGNRKTAATIELKGPEIHLDRDRSNGRTAVQQCWDYLANLPKCQWGIVSNMVSFRLYERNSTVRRYEHFSLQDLRDVNKFRQFYVLFHKLGILGDALREPKSKQLLERTNTRQKEVGDSLYKSYSEHRKSLIAHLHLVLKRSIEDSISLAQLLIDRIIFIAFCEDRDLLPDNTLARAYSDLPPFTQVTNPKWENFVRLFRGVDKGSPDLGLETGYNGGLFAPSEADDLDLDDTWTDFFKEVGDYDFQDEVNLDVLGHLFEKSITELEKLREGDLFAPYIELTGARTVRERPQMPQSALRKRMGIYYTPPAFTAKIVELAVDNVIEERFADVARKLQLDPVIADSVEYWSDCLKVLRNIKVVDPACGSGAFLFQAYEILEQRYTEVIDHLDKHDFPQSKEFADQISDMILNDNLYGVDLSKEAVEITQLALWIRSAKRGKTLADLSHNIKWGNSLVSDISVDPEAFDWQEVFPEVFDREESGFDCVIGNPPWERIKLQEREYFSLSAPEIATATNAAKRRKLIEKLPEENPQLYGRYIEMQERASKLLDYTRKSGDYPLTGKGDINTYAVFAELASKLVSPKGRVGLLLPSGIVSDMSTKNFFASITDKSRLICLYDFENKKGLFEEVHRSFKFSILLFGGTEVDQQDADFVFFAHQIEELGIKDKHIALSSADIKLLNPNTRTCPIFRTILNVMRKSLSTSIEMLLCW